MGAIERVLLNEFEKIPEVLLRDLLFKKLKEAGAPDAARIAEELAPNLLAGRAIDVHLETQDGEDVSIEIEVKSEEIEEITEKARRFIEEDFPHVVEGIREDIAALMGKTLNRRWPEQRAWEVATTQGFRERLEERWGEGFDHLRQMLTISREVGGELHAKWAKSKSKAKRHKREVLVRLHTRALQVVSEILALMEAGYADGAMARWRTLYEIDIVMSLVAKHGDEIAKRYLDHEICEARRALETYQDCHEALGFQPISQSQTKAIEARFAEVRSLYGREFVEPYGWAAKHLGTDGKRFIDLEKHAGTMSMRSFYKMASQNVHAGVKGVKFRLGLGGDGYLSGASNAGFVDPAQNAALSLLSITRALMSEQMSFDEQVQLQILTSLQGKVGPTLMRAARKLQKDEEAFQRSRKAKKSRKVRGKNCV